MRARLGVALVVVLAAGCVAPEAALVSGSPSAEVSASASPSVQPSPSPSRAVASSPAVSSTHLTTSGKGLTFTADLDRAEVAPGGAITITVSVHNERATDLMYGPTTCDPVVTVAVPLELPLDPAGKTWTGVPGRFKAYALTEGYYMATKPPTLPVVTGVPAPPCPVVGPAPPTLGPGQTLTRTVVWHAEYAAGIPALPQTTDLKLTFAFDPDFGPPPPSPSPGGVIGSRMIKLSELVLEAPISVVGAAPKLLTTGQAVDAFLADPQIGPWVVAHANEPAWTVQVFLENGERTKTQPAGPAWDVEFFAEHAVASNKSALYGRAFVRAYIDPFDGHVIFRDFCNAPCDR